MILIFVDDFATKVSIKNQIFIIWHSKYRQLMMVWASESYNGFCCSFDVGIAMTGNGHNASSYT
jgi:hypothetical protein